MKNQLEATPTTLSALSPALGGKRTLLTISIAVWLTLLAACYSMIPPSPDQFQMEYLASRVLQGDRFYVDLVNVDWPGPILSHALSAWWVPENLYPWRIADFFFMCIAVAATAAVFRHISRAASLAIWIVYPTLYVTSLHSWLAGEKDMVGAHWVLTGVAGACYGVRTSRPLAFLLSSILIGLAVLQKPTLGAAIIAVALCPLLLRRARGWRAAAHGGALSGIGMSLGVAAGFLTVWSTGTPVSKLYEGAVTVNQHVQFGYVEPWADMGWRLLYITGAWWHWIAAVAIGAFVYSLRLGREVRGLALVYGVTLAAGVASYFVQRKGFDYHASLIYSALAVWCCIGTGILVAKAWRPSRITVRLPLLLACLLVFAGISLKVTRLATPLAVLAGTKPRSVLLEHARSDANTTMAQVARLVSAVKERVPDTGRVFVLGNSCAINHLTGRPQPTRFYYSPLLNSRLPSGPLGDRFLREFEQDMSPPSADLLVLSQSFLNAVANNEDQRFKVTLDRVKSWYVPLASRDGYELLVPRQ